MFYADTTKHDSLFELHPLGEVHPVCLTFIQDVRMHMFLNCCFEMMGTEQEVVKIVVIFAITIS